MQLLGFVKKLQVFNVMFGRVSSIFRGLKDGGAKAAEINDPDIAVEYNGNTIFNVNSATNEPFGGHFHNPTFSYNYIRENQDLVVPQYQQMVVHRTIKVDGRLIVRGQVVIL